MAQRDWRVIVDSWEASRPGRMNVRLLVHLAMRMDAVDEQAITTEVLREKRQAYEDELTAQAAKVGCRDRQGIMDETMLKSAHEQSVTEGTGIVNTYNYDLANAINTIHDQIPSANRNTYSKYLLEWHSARSQWKDPQISLHNRMEWRAKAVDDFTRMNNVEGYAVLVPSHPASCAICKRLAGKRMRIQDAQRFIQEWPPHLNCIHHWEVKPTGDMRCEDLWVGKEPAGFTVKEATMIIVEDSGGMTAGQRRQMRRRTGGY